jgi:hypothetical protein
MSQSPAVKIRLENILVLTGCSIALSTIVFSLSSNVSYISYLFTPPVAMQTVIYHFIVLIIPHLSCFRRNPSNSEAAPPPFPHAIMRPAIGLAGFLCVAWLTAAGLSIAGIFTNNSSSWWHMNVVIAWIHFVLAVVETGVMVAIVVQAALARKSMEQEGGIQI